MTLAQRLTLQKVWDEIPDTDCKGLCVESCGPVDGGPIEREMLASQGVYMADSLMAIIGALQGEEIESCPALVDGRCTVYEIRPTVCRLWGAVDDMPCPWGCVPEGGRLSAREGRQLMVRALGAQE